MLIRLLTYNIKSGGHGREELILDILRQSQADIIVLQEAFDDTPLHAFAQALDMDYYIAASNVNWCSRPCHRGCSGCCGYRGGMSFVL
jgi:endonuclease/exonuclease/phosphatase family metal-dependent hydrolase